MEQLICMCHQTVQELAQKTTQTTLNEFEMLMYEQLCNMLKAHSGYLEILFKKCSLESELDFMVMKKKHKQWLKEHGEPDEE